MTYREYLRQKKLREMYAELTDKDKYMLESMSIQQQKLDEVLRRQGRLPFAKDLLANVSGNVITSGLIYLGKLLRKI